MTLTAEVIGRPWRAERSKRDHGRVIVRRADGAWMVDLDGENAEPLAELIVSAVNAQGRQFEPEEGEILEAIGQKYRGDHNIETLLVILTRVAFERLQLLQALKELIEASGSMAPVGGEARYEAAVERAEAAIAKVKV
jgi:hypothetical protein